MAAKSNKRNAYIALFLFYVFLVGELTICNRAVGSYNAQYSLFWSYKKWLSGDLWIGKQIIENVLLFIPLGFLLLDRKRFLLWPLVVSIGVELIQLITLRGYFELDDIINNSIGAVIGWRIGRYSRYKTNTGVISILALSIICVMSPQVEGPTNFPKILCFQSDGGTGFAFRPKNDDSYSILLRNTQTGVVDSVKANYRINRPDVAKYFGNEYQNSGFEIEFTADAEYEFEISFNPFLTIPTGVNISPEGIHYV